MIQSLANRLGCFSLVFFVVLIEVHKVAKNMSKGRVYKLLQEIKETEQTVAISSSMNTTLISMNLSVCITLPV